jgi:uncharacterized protein YqjF (DUF2071 family)
MASSAPISNLQAGLAFLTAEWRYLIMLNYEIDPAILARIVPKGTARKKNSSRSTFGDIPFRNTAVQPSIASSIQFGAFGRRKVVVSTATWKNSMGRNLCQRWARHLRRLS